MNTGTVSARTIADFIDLISQNAASIDFDAEIIKSIVSGWKNGDPSDKEKLKAKLAEISQILD